LTGPAREWRQRHGRGIGAGETAGPAPGGFDDTDPTRQDATFPFRFSMPRRVLVFVFALLTCLLPLPALAQTGAVAPTLLVDQNVERLHLEFPQDPTVTW